MAAKANTRKTNKIAAGSELLQSVRDNILDTNTENLLKLIHNLEKTLQSIYSGKCGKYPKIENKPFHYFTDGSFYITDPLRYLVPDTGNVPSMVENVNTTYINYERFKMIYNSHEVCPVFTGYDSNGYRQITNKNKGKYSFIAGYAPSYYRRFGIYNNGSSYSYWDSCNYMSDVHSSGLRLPICTETGIFNAVKNNLMPSDLTASEKKLFVLLAEYQNKGWLEWDNNSVKNFSSEFFVALKNNQVDDFEDMCFKTESIDNYIKDGKTVHLSEKARADLVDRLVNVDNIRIALSPYEESRLTDPNGGHWDLWSVEASKNETMIEFDAAFYGRNPAADVHHDGIVGIDFGTKSTVVTVQDGNDIIIPMRIGKGDYKKDVTAADYENPTMMEFINLESFLSSYNSSECRPETKWKDLTISHTAVSGFNSSETGEKYYAWFSDLKQWASDKNRTIIIRDKQENPKEIELVPFANLSSTDLNPIEIYAYLLGLFINNMYNGIYINYILSFPVTYERRIRQKIAESFSNGLKRSLPKSVRNDKNIMNLFRVLEGASEPAAYAVCALQEYGFNPKENEKILYGIFDFGGGTTDFDFGTWQRAPKNLQRRYDYVIKHFGAGGDRLLGGENLLELLAYSVFKKNESILRQNEVQFTKPADADKYCGTFEGCEALISNSQQAKINQKKLAEELRPLWHGEEYSKEKVKLNFYNTKNAALTVELAVDIAELKALIRRRIDSGVENFFEAMKNAVSDDIAQGVDNIQIFLAGNSSKSQVVTESFNKYKKIYEPVFAKKLNKKTNDKNTGIGNYFVAKYAEDWKDICQTAANLRNDGVLISDFNFIAKKVPENDSFVVDLSGAVCVELLDLLIETNKTDNLMIDMYALWVEGVLTVSKMSDMVDALIKYDMKVCDDIINFIYSNAEVPQLLKAIIEEHFEVNLNEEINKQTYKFLDPKNSSSVFVLYPSLGTNESDEIRKSMGLTINNSVARPTGKTGVAYGLLECRPGSRIKVESEIKETDEIKFNFYTGYASMGKFEVLTDRDIEYGKWIEFIDASEPDFELYYTDLPEAVGNQMSIHGVSKKNCRIDETRDDATVYIRAVEPSVLEYCAAFGEEELNKREYLSPPKKIILE